MKLILKTFTLFQIVAMIGLYSAPFAYAAPTAIDNGENTVETDENTAPIANNDSATTDEDTPITIDVLANDTDTDGDDFFIESYTTNSENNGSINRTQDEQLRYTPAAGFTGTDTFTYVIEDENGAESNTAVVRIDVGEENIAPIANNDTSSTNKNKSVTISPLNNDTDSNDDELSIESFTSSTTNGSIARSASDNNKLIYTPNTDFVGSDSFDYIATDGELNDSATIKVVVNDVDVIPSNTAPIANNDSATTDEDTPITIDVLANDTDTDGDDFFIESYTTNSENNGSINRTQDEQLRYTPAAGFTGTDTFTYVIEDENGAESNTAVVRVLVGNVSGAPVNATDDGFETNENTQITFDVLLNDRIDNLDMITNTNPINGQLSQVSTEDNPTGRFTYMPNQGFTGKDTFNYTISDGVNTDSAIVTITVKPIGTGGNTAPIANNDSATTDEDTPITIDVLANDTDTDGDDFFIESYTTNSENNGSINRTQDEQLRYTPAAGFTGTDTFTYVIEDENGAESNTAVVRVLVKDDNNGGGGNPMNANTDNFCADAGEMNRLDVLANDSNKDGLDFFIDGFTEMTDNATLSIEAGQVQYTPNSGFTGSDYFVYRAEDDNGNSDTARVNVTVESNCDGNNGGGGGGGGGGGLLDPYDPDDDGEVAGDEEVDLDIYDERLTILPDGRAFILWRTNVPATSQVVYGDNSVRNPAGICGTDLGYDRRTNVNNTLREAHAVVIDNIDNVNQFYFRPVSDRDDADCAKGDELTLAPVQAQVCTPYLNDFLRIGQINNPREVAKLEAFLRIYQNEDVVIDGIFDQQVDQAVKRFQVQYYNEVLAPWGYQPSEATGYVYITTRNKINEIICQRDYPFTASQLTEIAAFRNFWAGRFNTPVANVEKAAGIDALLPDGDEMVEEPLEVEEEIAEEIDEITNNVEDFVDEVTDANDDANDLTAAVDDSGAFSKILGFIFSLPFLLLVLGALVALLVRELWKDQKDKEVVVNDNN